MPIYEYQCPDCGHRFEKLQKISDDPITDCPECSGAQVRKLVSQAAFILKGSGWYKDHYGLKKGGSGDGASASTASDAASSSGSDAAGTGKDSTSSASSAKPPSTAASSSSSSERAGTSASSGT